jgi:hypothetical protein
MLFLVRYDEVRFTRTLASFNPGLPKYIVEFDASLTGVGILLYQRVDGGEVCLGGAAVDITVLGFKGDSAFQNLAEYIGALVGILGLVHLGVHHEDLEMRGDSVTALTWAQTERARGVLVSNAAMIFTSVCIRYGMDVKTATHRSGEDNFRCDELSRLAESGLSARAVMDDLGFTACRVLDLTESQSFRRLVELCSPGIEFVNEESFERFWGDIRGALEGLGEEPTDPGEVPGY